jgi:molybdenum-dependent DNA-binding transcriptional regulator ModE
MPSTDSLSLRDAANALGLSMGTVRGYVKRGALKATKQQGKFGEEFRIRPAVLGAFAAEHLHVEIDVDALRARQGSAQESTASPAEVSPDVIELYERLLKATEEATRYRAIAESSESSKVESQRAFDAMLAEARNDLDAAQTKADQAAAELAKLKSRGFWGRVFRQ